MPETRGQLIEFVDVFGQTMENFYTTKYAIRMYPTPTKHSAKFYLRSGLSDDECVSFEAEGQPGFYLTTDEDLSHWPELLTIKNHFPSGSATFCKENNLLVSFLSKKNENKNVKVRYVLSRWNLSRSERALKFDDRFAIARMEQLPSSNSSEFIPVLYREVMPDQFADKYSISPSGGGPDPAYKYYLSAGDSGLKVKKHAFLVSSESDTDISSWYFHHLDNENFVIQNSKTGKYLSFGEGGLSLLPLVETFARRVGRGFDSHKIKQNLIWCVKRVSREGNYVILKENNGEQLSLFFDYEGQGGVKLDVKPFHSKSLSQGVLLNITERLSNMKIIPEDIVAQNSIVRLYNGLEQIGIFNNHSLFGGNVGFGGRKITIDDSLHSGSYFFASSVGEDYSTNVWFYDKENNASIDLKSLVYSLPAVSMHENSELKEDIYLSVVEQITGAQLDFQRSLSGVGGSSAAIIYLAPFEKIPTYLPKTYIDTSEKTLRVIGGERDKFFDRWGYGFLLKKINHAGQASYTIYDPLPTTNDPR